MVKWMQEILKAGEEIMKVENSRGKILSIALTSHLHADSNQPFLANPTLLCSLKFFLPQL